MASSVLTNAYAYVAGYDFTGDANKLQVTASAEKKVKTTFRSQGWEESVKGLRSMSFELAGYTGFAAAEADVEQFTTFAADVSQVGTCGPAETEGELAWLSACGVYDYTAYDAIGEISPMKLTGTGRDPYGLVRGVLLKKLGSVSATGATGTAVQAGAVGANQFLYGSFHVFGTPGTTVTAVVESAAASNFSGATTRLTFGPLTAAGGTWATRVAGAITDTWWRVRVTTITGTFSVACAIGIQ